MNTVKKLVAVYSLLLLGNKALAQTMATANHGEIGVVSLKVSYCDGTKYKITNTTQQAIDVLYYYKRKSGQWSDARATNGIAPGQAIMTSDMCDNGGSHILYYRPAGSNDKFPNRPSASE